MEVIKINREDKEFPERLLSIKKCPSIIYAIGDINLLNSKYTVGIVGSRNCTEYGIRVTNEFSKKLSQKGMCIISGMAIGIDGVAHNSAINEIGKTIAVLGGGFNHISPEENEWLFHKILKNGGCLISEYSLDELPDKNNFPVRNRLISGLSDAILVTEAEHRSGSSITVKYANEQGKTVYAIPSNIYSYAGIGTNRMIQEGAILATKPEQIIADIVKVKLNNTDDNKQTSREERKSYNKSRGYSGRLYAHL